MSHFKPTAKYISSDRQRVLDREPEALAHVSTGTSPLPTASNAPATDRPAANAPNPGDPSIVAPGFDAPHSGTHVTTATSEDASDAGDKLFISAAETGDKFYIKHLLENGANPEAVDSNGRTALLWAAENGHEAVVNLLIDHGANSGAVDSKGRTALLGAAENGHEAVVKVLIDKGADINAEDNDGRTPLSWASMYGHEAVVKVLLDKGANINVKDNNGRTLLSCASMHGHEAVVKVLIDKGADINAEDNNGRTPLLCASMHGHEAVVKVLLDKGADINAEDNNGRTSLSYASIYRCEAVVKVLLDKGADINAEDNNGRTPLLWASMHGHEAVVKVLIDKGADINAEDNDGRTPLSWAAEIRSKDIVNLLIGNGAHIEARDNDGRTPLSRANEKWNEAAVQLLSSALGDGHGAIARAPVEHDGTQTMTEGPPTDSGYASTAVINKRLGRESEFDDKPIEDAFQESTNECVHGKAATVYSDASSTTSFTRERYALELAHHLASEVQLAGMNQDIKIRMLEVLPELLRNFALKIGHGTSDQMHRNVMAFVHRSRHEIAAAFADVGFIQEEDTIEEEWTDLDAAFLKTRISDWVEDASFEQNLPEERNETMSIHPDSPNSKNMSKSPNVTEESDESDESEEGEDKSESLFQAYREFIVKTSAFEWLLSRLRNEIRLVTMKPDSREAIGKEIMSALPSPSRIISKKIPSQSYSATFELEWDVFEFFEAQGYSRPPHEVFASVITLTGSSLDAQAATCAQYLGQTWPFAVDDMIAVMEDVLKERRSDPLLRTLSDGTTLGVCVRDSKFLAEVHGVATTIVEIGEQLAWLGAALRTSPEQSGLIYCTPTISIQQKEVPSSQSELQPRSNFIACKIGFITEKIQTTLTTNGQCWQAVFRNSVIVRGYPIPQRAEWKTGLEVPLNIMAGLARALEVQQFKDKVCMKGFSTMLVPIQRIGDILCWHLLYKKDGSRISYLDNDLDQEKDIAGFDRLQNTRHVLGWCSKAKIFVGSSVKHSMLGKPEVNGALTGRFVRRGRAVPGSASILIGARESPQLFPDGYIRRLQFLKNQWVLLWDKDDKRGWLVRGTIALLLALRAFFEGPYKSAINFKSKQFREPGNHLTAESAFDTLSNDHNQNLLLYSDGTRLKTKIEDLCILLEHLIDHQIDITENSDIKLSEKPRSDLEGWEFEDVAGMDQDPVHPRMAEIEAHGKGWVDFIRAIQAVTLFGCGFGDVIRPDVKTCSGWATLPVDRYYIAVCISDLEKVFKEHGFRRDGHIRLSDNLIWHTPAKSEFCQCTSGSDQDNCEPVQMIFPLSLSESLSPRGKKLPKEGALIFGHSSQFSWVWDDFGDPQEGQLGEQVSGSHKDSGIGSSLTPSVIGSQPSPVTRSDSRFMESPIDTYSNAAALPVSGTVCCRYSKDFYTVGIICALPKELKVVRALFDEVYDSPEDVTDNTYVFAKMGKHKVVARCLSMYGTNDAALVAGDMKHTFNLQFCLLVGIGGGVPSQDNDIRLGDVVVGKEIIQYDLGKRRGGDFEMREQPLRNPLDMMGTVNTTLRADPDIARNPLGCLLQKISNSELIESYRKLREDQDILFQPCSECRSSPEACPQKDQHVQVQREPRLTPEPEIHYGKIASGNQVIKDAVFRDELARKLNVMCFEMEAAGVINILPCLVIRGICDYCDVHKNDDWQNYAAATAAAYAKLLLTVVSPRDMHNSLHGHSAGTPKNLRGTKRQWSQVSTE